MIKQAVILAAGRGKRMQAVLPKPLLEVNGMPIIERNIKKLAGMGVEIAVVINPADRKAFEERLAKYEIEYIYQARPQGTASALFCAKDFIREPLFLVMMGDDITDYSVDELLSISEPTVFGLEVSDVSNYGAIVADSDDLIEDIVEKQRSGKGVVNTGVYVMPRDFFRFYKEITVDEKTKEYFLTKAPQVLGKHGIRFRLRKLGYWLGVNTKEELKKAEETLRKREHGAV